MYNFLPDILLLIEQYSCGELEWVAGEGGQWKEPTFVNTFKIIKNVSPGFQATVADNYLFSLFFSQISKVKHGGPKTQ